MRVNLNAPYGVLVTMINGCGPSERVGVPVGWLVGVKVSVGICVAVYVLVGVSVGMGVAEGAGVSVDVGASRVSVKVGYSVSAGGMRPSFVLDPISSPMFVICGIRITSRNRMMIDRLTSQTFVLYKARFQFG
jgi:hypothetical protein